VLNAFVCDKGSEVFLQPPVDDGDVPAYYVLDYASVMIVEHLGIEAFHRVLDLCSAPGGKAIAISQYLSPSGEISCNEAQPERFARLRRNVQSYIPQNSCVVHLTQRDATTWHNPCAYDRVLVDAPCSAERHLVLQPGGTALWSDESSRLFAKQQLSLLLRAIETTKVGGIVVYSTCSMSPLENDDVVESALQKSRCDIRCRETKLALGEPTRYGWIVLPDAAEGWGPMYCATLAKMGDLRSTKSSSESDSGEDS
jgi:16S rRNA C967 or C1407 C5-methylase (RsmB/RsmF family)